MYGFVKYLKDIPREVTDKISKSIEKELIEVEADSTIQENRAYKEASYIVINS